MLDLDRDAFALDTPEACGELGECKVRLYLDDASGAGHFHVVGREARDNSLIYTEPAMVRLVAL
jgi:hypothetical protein